MTLSQRCSIYADKMQNEGWYTTANVLALAAQRIDEAIASLKELQDHYHAKGDNDSAYTREECLLCARIDRLIERLRKATD